MITQMKRCFIGLIWLLILDGLAAWMLPKQRFSVIHSSLNYRTLLEESIHRDYDVPKYDVNILLIDHYDSFTYNLVDLVAQSCQNPPYVRAHDGLRRIDLSEFDGIILSPGPGNPSEYPASERIIREAGDMPILGVCLGHQLLGRVHGATIERTHPVHGHVCEIERTDVDDPLWKGMPLAVNATRYHSLHVTNLPDCLVATAHYQTTCMGLRHTSLPQYGVQFHPESIGTLPLGKQLLDNFLEICHQHKVARSGLTSARASIASPSYSSGVPLDAVASVNGHSQHYQVIVRKVKCNDGPAAQPLDVFRWYENETFAFWLDEAKADGNTPAVSILGAGTKLVEYWGSESNTTLPRGVYRHDTTLNTSEYDPRDILAYLQDQHQRPLTTVTMLLDDGSLVEFPEDQVDIPFAYRGGHVGYLGYEVRHDTERYLCESEHGLISDRSNHRLPTVSDSQVPTAAFIWADRSLVYDHQGHDWYLIGVRTKEQSTEDILEWMRQASLRLELSSIVNGLSVPFQVNKMQKQIHVPTVFVPNRSRGNYLRNFDKCMEHIKSGDSYELCLTNQLETTISVPWSSPIKLYELLRRRNPAPFSAFFDWNSSKRHQCGSGSALAICCSSPERFVSVKRRNGASLMTLEVEAKPIKGTCARVLPSNGVCRTLMEEAEDTRRAQQLQNSIKDRAENLMIVDLLRNDLNRVCETGTVHVTKLMDIESYQTVHQMVTTIRGQLNLLETSAVDVLKSCFPGGSMTGAPKLHTMDLLHEIEEGDARGPYSGCLGYISVNGCMDMNIVIRTALLTPGVRPSEWKVKIGAGGAITALSERNDEYEEMMIKASAVLGAVRQWAHSPWGSGTEAFLAPNKTEVFMASNTFSP